MKVWFRPHVLLATDDSNIAMWWNDATCVMLWRPFQWNDLSLATSTPPKSNFFVGNSGILPVYSLKSFYHPGNESYIPPLQARKTIDWKVLNGKGYVIVPRRVNINDIPGVTWLRRYIYIYSCSLPTWNVFLKFLGLPNSYAKKIQTIKSDSQIYVSRWTMVNRYSFFQFFWCLEIPFLPWKTHLLSWRLEVQKDGRLLWLGEKHLGTKRFISWRWCKYFLGTSRWCSWALSKNVLNFLSKKAVFFQVQLWIKFGDFCIANLQSIPWLGIGAMTRWWLAFGWQSSNRCRFYGSFLAGVWSEITGHL